MVNENVVVFIWWLCGIQKQLSSSAASGLEAVAGHWIGDN
jgi:hypothetical protein